MKRDGDGLCSDAFTGRELCQQVVRGRDTGFVPLKSKGLSGIEHKSEQG
jgi:hypothetical protein